MNFLIVDDDDIKIAKIRQVIEGCASGLSAHIVVQQTVSDAVNFLLYGPVVDIMILDLNLPIRKQTEVKALSGLKIITEINRRPGMVRPAHIIGLTGHIPPPSSAEQFFKDEGWVLIGYDPKQTDWEVTVQNKIFYIGEKRGVALSLEKKGILYLAATPADGRVIMLAKEERRISETLRMSTHRADYSLTTRQGCTLGTMTAGLMAESPVILHFSGHGDGEGIALEDEEGNMQYVSSDTLHKLFTQFAKDVQCIILGSCYSADQAALLSKDGVYVIGMQDSISVGICEEFAVGFYQALGERQDIRSCFALGKIMAKAKFEESEDVPQLWYKGILLE